MNLAYIEPDLTASDEYTNCLGDSTLMVSWLWRQARVRCVQFVCRRHPGLDDDEVASSVTTAHIDFGTIVEEGFSGDEDEALALLLSIADRRACDLYRKKSALKRGGGSPIIYLEDLEENGRGVGQASETIDEIELEETRRHLRHLAESLPEKQKLLAELMADQLPEELRLADVPVLLEAKKIPVPSRTSLKRALEHLRGKLRSDPFLLNLRHRDS